MPLETLWLTETQVQDITVLKGNPVMSLDIEKTPISDLSPLSGNTNLKRLNIADSAVTDLTPLKGLKLERLIFSPEKIEKGLDVVMSMPSIQQIGQTFDTVTQPAVFWSSLPQPTPEKSETPPPAGTTE
ncbi:MAG TPA: hypothetical protein DD473_12800 [Planctomycetaceae bacterium]|nr:hypothetical protein [Planctomycetaceae bacterium]